MHETAIQLLEKAIRDYNSSPASMTEFMSAVLGVVKDQDKEIGVLKLRVEELEASSS